MDLFERPLNGLSKFLHLLLDHLTAPRDHLNGDGLAIKQDDSAPTIEESADLFLDDRQRFVKL